MLTSVDDMDGKIKEFEKRLDEIEGYKLHQKFNPENS